MKHWDQLPNQKEWCNNDAMDHAEFGWIWKSFIMTFSCNPMSQLKISNELPNFETYQRSTAF